MSSHQQNGSNGTAPTGDTSAGPDPRGTLSERVKEVLKKHGIPESEAEGAVRWMLRHPISLNLVPFYYLLGGPEMHDPVAIASMDDWMAWMYEHRHDGTCRVALWVGADTEGEEVHVSTVFLGYDVNMTPKPTSCFETICIADERVPMAGWEWRAGTWEQALENHNLVVAAVTSWRDSELELRRGQADG